MAQAEGGVPKSVRYSYLPPHFGSIHKVIFSVYILD